MIRKIEALRAKRNASLIVTLARLLGEICESAHMNFEASASYYMLSYN